MYARVFKQEERVSSSVSAGTGASAGGHKSNVALRLIRETAANISINPYEAQKKSKDANKILLLRRLGLLEPERNAERNNTESTAVNNGTPLMPNPLNSAASVAFLFSSNSESDRPAPRRSAVAGVLLSAAAEALMGSSSPVSLSSNGAGAANGSTQLQGAVPRRPSRLVTAGSQLVDLTISNIKVRNLKSSAVIGDANPYVTVSLNDPSIEPLKTDVKWNSETASWSDELVFHRIDSAKLHEGTLDVQVYDKERIRRKMLLGAVQIKLTGVDVRNVSSWFALEGGSSGNNGEIHLSINSKPSASS